MKNHVIALAALLCTGIGLLNGANAGPPAPTNPAATIGSLGAPGPVFNAASYGAVCDGVTDDAPAINAAITAARVADVLTNDHPITIVTPPRGCAIKESLNLTGLTSVGTTVDFTLVCETNNQPCIDAYGSRQMHWNLNISTNATETLLPNIGLQIGRTDGTVPCDTQRFDHIDIRGIFYLAPIYLYGCEDTTFHAPYIFNSYSGTNSYGMIFDAYNHFGVTSQFVTVTAPANVTVSMNSNLLLGANVYSTGSGASSPLWIGGGSMFKAVRSYFSAVNNPIYAVTLYNEDANGIVNLDMDAHFEHTTNLQYCFYMTGTYAPVLDSFHYSDKQAECQTGLFATDSALTSVTMSNVDISLDSFYPVNNLPLFDVPSKYTLTGKVALPSLTSWTEPNGFQGTLCTFTPSACYQYVPTQVLNRNPDMLVDQVGGGGGAVSSVGTIVNLMDGWATGGGVTGLGMSFQQATVAPPGYKFSFEQRVTAAGTPSAAQHADVESVIEGSDAAALQWGTPNAKPITWDFWAYANNAGQYSRYLMSSGVLRSYVVTYNITAANTWQHFVFHIPGDTGGGADWGSQPGTVGLRYGQALSMGSNFNQPGTGWQSGRYYNSASDFNFGGTVGAILYIAADHIFAGQFDLPYQARPLAAELDMDYRFYQKSCAYATVCQKVASLGTVGALAFRLPYGQATSSNAATPVTFAHPMYSTPTLSFYSTTAATANCYDSTTAADGGAASALDAGPNGFGLNCALVSGQALGDQVQVQWSAGIIP